MNVAILEVARYGKGKNIIDAHMRNSMILRDAFGWDLLSEFKEYKKSLNKKYDKLVVSYSSYYAPVKYMEALVNNNPSSEIFWITNEYNIHINGCVNQKDRGISIISNIEKKTVKQNVNKFFFINLNTLIMKPLNKYHEKKYDCIYYGTFRTNRADYFKKYLHKPVYLSTSIKNFKKFKHIGLDPNYITKLTWEHKKETLNLFRYSLYIEDVFTHTCFNHLANRFYEALFCNTITLFDENCLSTIQKSNLKDYDIFIVKNHNDLVKKIEEFNKNFIDVLEIQKKWVENALIERKSVLKEIQKIVENRSLN